MKGLTEKMRRDIKKFDKKYKVIDKDFICRCDDLKSGKAIVCWRHGKKSCNCR